MPVLKATERSTGRIRLVNQKTRQKVESHLLADTYLIESITTSELAELVKQGIEIENPVDVVIEAPAAIEAEAHE